MRDFSAACHTAVVFILVTNATLYFQACRRDIVKPDTSLLADKPSALKIVSLVSFPCWLATAGVHE